MVGQQSNRWNCEWLWDGGRWDSTPAGWFDRTTDIPNLTNKLIGKPTTDHPYFQLTSISKQTNHPDRLAINPTTDYRSIHPTNRWPTSQRQFLQTTIAWIPGIGIQQSPQFCQAGCIAVSASIQAKVQTYPHFSIGPALLRLTLICMNPLSNHQISEEGYLTHACKSLIKFGALFTYTPLGVYNPLRFDMAPLTRSGNASWVLICFAMSFVSIVSNLEDVPGLAW